MLKKVMILAAALMLLAAAAPLVMAQDIGQQNTGHNQYMDQYVNQAQSAAPQLQDITSLDANNNLLVNCDALPGKIGQLANEGFAVKNSPNLQLVLTQAEALMQLCIADGFAPPNSG
jgi:hypothetical protein